MPRKDRYESPIADYSSECTWGWLSPEGKFHGCKQGNHSNMAKAMGSTAKYMLSKGWAIVWNEEYGCQRALTQEQKDWFESKGLNYVRG